MALIALHVALVPGVTGQRDHTAPDPVRVTVLQGTASPATQQLVDGLRRRLEQVGRRSVVTIVTTDDAAAPRGATSSPDVVIALGARAMGTATRDYRGVPLVGALLTRESVQPAGSGTPSLVLEFAPEVELDWMRRMLPQARRVGVLYSSDANARLVTRARDIARAMGFELVARRISSPSEIPRALSAMSGQADVLWGLADDRVLTPETAQAVLLNSLRTKLPFVGLSTQWVRGGAVYALDRDYTDMGAQAADLAVRVLDGLPLRGLESVPPRKLVYAVNLRSAALMRITIPDNLKRGATEVIQ